MEDNKIIELFFDRNERAINEVSIKYGKLALSVSSNILGNKEDATECVNDAYLGMWNTIPPQNPNPLLAYVSRIVRNIAIAKYHSNTAIKRNSFYDIALDELESCLASSSSVEDELTAKELTIMLNCFLDTLEREKRVMFVRRYWYADSIPEIAERFHISNNYVSVCLSRIRGELKRYLEKEGAII